MWTLESDYSALGASTGQFSAQEPQSMHLSASISYLPSPSVIAPTGQFSAQAPQEMQSSLILYSSVYVVFLEFPGTYPKPAPIISYSQNNSRGFYEFFLRMPEICKKLSGTVRKPEVCSAPSVPQAFHALEML